MPSVKNPLSFSSLMLLNGRTARDLSLAGAGTAGAATVGIASGGIAGACAGRKTTNAPSPITATPSSAAAQSGIPVRTTGVGTADETCLVGADDLLLAGRRGP